MFRFRSNSAFRSFPIPFSKLPSFFVCFFYILFLTLFLLFLRYSYLYLIFFEDFNDVNEENFEISKIDFEWNGGQNDIKDRLAELIRIKISVRGELRALEEKRFLMTNKIESLLKEIESLRGEANKARGEYERLKVSLSVAKVSLEEFNIRNTPESRPPFSLRINGSFIIDELAASPVKNVQDCSFLTCFDYSKCSLTSGFPVYFYESPKNKISKVLSFPFRTMNPLKACLFVVMDFKEGNLSSLSFWNGEGRNHLLFNPSNSLPSLHSHRALIAHHNLSFFRPQFDVLLPFPSPFPLTQTSPLIPIRRPYLLAYFYRETPKDSALYSLLSQINEDKTDDKVKLIDCSLNSCNWTHCNDATFTLLDTFSFPSMLSQILHYGSIPVSLQKYPRKHVFPFDERIDWNLIGVSLPRSRLPELHFYLRSFPDSDLFFLKRQGRLVLHHYFSNPLLTTLHIIRDRLQIPSPPFDEEPSPSVFNSSFSLLRLKDLPYNDLENSGESLGPLEAPSPSPTFRRNFSTLSLNHYNEWNKYFSSFALPPYSPLHEFHLPTEAKFLESPSGFRPIGHGLGGTGQEFRQALGGNTPREQFTIVLLTYERENVLMDSLARLIGLPYLNKVVVVWNSQTAPSEDLKWPNIGVPIEVIRTRKNSLNNRFLPYSVIETEAILSVDDDAHLRHDEIIFGFRVWRENKDKLVGFPGRYHAWDSTFNSWNYNSNYSCELSMVLTGAAFFHKYYSYIYSYVMPQAIRDKVDEYMNCEDLAMNFLISHITRSPPVKVTSRWTFRCPGCPISLSEDESHFIERHKCINFFKDIYGYMPLVYTQYRADSILFKTRIPVDKQKCFKFI